MTSLGPAFHFAVEGGPSLAPHHATLHRTIGQAARLHLVSNTAGPIGARVTVRADQRILFVGTIEQVATTGGENDVTAKGLLHRLDRDLRIRHLPPAGPRSTIERVCAPHGVTLDLGSLPDLPELDGVQHYETDLAMCLHTAARVGAYIHEMADTIVVRTSPNIAGAEHLTEQDLIGSITMVQNRTEARREATAMFLEEGRVESLRTAGDADATWAIAPGAARNAAALRDSLTVQNRIAASGSLHVRGTTSSPAVEVGGVIILPPGSPRVDALFVVETTQQFGAGDQFQCHFVAIPVDQAAPVLSPVRPARKGLVPGIIVDTRDPRQLGRVMVRLTDEPDDSAPVWAWVGREDAGADHGSFVQPAIDDCVLVAFLGGDPARPTVVKPIHHGGHAPPTDAEQEGATARLLRTRNGTEVVLHREADCDRLVIRFGNGVEVVLGGDDDAITVRCQGDLNLHAKNITLNALEKLALAATSIEAIAKQGIVLDGSQIAIG